MHHVFKKNTFSFSHFCQFHCICCDQYDFSFQAVRDRLELSLHASYHNRSTHTAPGVGVGVGGSNLWIIALHKTPMN